MGESIKDVLARIKKSQNKPAPAPAPAPEVDEDEELEQETEEEEEEEIKELTKKARDPYQDELKALKEQLAQIQPKKEQPKQLREHQEEKRKAKEEKVEQIEQPVEEVQSTKKLSIAEEIEILQNNGIYRREVIARISEISEQLKDLNTLIASLING